MSVATLIRQLWWLFVIEGINAALHFAFAGRSTSFGWADALSVTLTAILVFLAGWLVITRGLGAARTAIVAALLVWVFSTLVSLVGVLLQPIASNGDAGIRAGGLIIGSVLLLPVAVGIAWIAVILARRYAGSRSGGKELNRT